MTQEGDDHPVRRLSERIARRELLRRGGGLAAGGAFATWLLGTSEASAGSPGCGNYGCRCNHSACPSCPHRRYAGQHGVPGCYWAPSQTCWAIGNGQKCCDYWCNHHPCRCCGR
jgi:hypothetical protein